MKNDSSAKSMSRVMRTLPGLAAPQGAAIAAAYLVGMVGIAAGALAMRGEQAAPPPALVTDIAPRLPQPAVQAALPDSPDTAHHPATPATAPRLAALAPTDTRLSDDLISPLSRIFLGQPAAVPPERPGPGDDPAAGDAPAPLRSAALRPRRRPTNLVATRGDTADALRLASLAAPGQADARETPEEPAAVPATPRIAAASGSCPSRLAGAVPRRRGNAPGAQAVLAGVQGVDGVKRDQQVLGEILRGNIPDFLRNLVPVSVSGRAADGTDVQITLCVTPDYLALGSDRDFVRVPLGLRAATRIGEEFNMILPTPRMVDTIYRAAQLRLSPQPMSPGPQMTSTAYFVRHNATVEAQRRSAGAAPGTLISGHKKDVVLTTRLMANRGRVALYGWHRRNGRPIQPLSTVHGAGYADYSHGVRLVSRTAFLDGQAVDLRSLMADPRYAGLLSHEGPIGGPSLRMAALASN